jgi:hypothetical protein
MLQILKLARKKLQLYQEKCASQASEIESLRSQAKLFESKTLNNLSAIEDKVVEASVDDTEK